MVLGMPMSRYRATRARLFFIGTSLLAISGVIAFLPPPVAPSPDYDLQGVYLRVVLPLAVIGIFVIILGLAHSRVGVYSNGIALTPWALGSVWKSPNVIPWSEFAAIKFRLPRAVDGPRRGAPDAIIVLRTGEEVDLSVRELSQSLGGSRRARQFLDLLSVIQTRLPRLSGGILDPSDSEVRAILEPPVGKK